METELAERDFVPQNDSDLQKKKQLTEFECDFGIISRLPQPGAKKLSVNICHNQGRGSRQNQKS